MVLSYLDGAFNSGNRADNAIGIPSGRTSLWACLSSDYALNYHVRVDGRMVVQTLRYLHDRGLVAWLSEMDRYDPHQPLFRMHSCRTCDRGGCHGSACDDAVEDYTLVNLYGESIIRRLKNFVRTYHL